ncbi:unnamed protein product [Oikopleura dioica]|uniref:EF-hand domain-containing protein n=1 Tax=Oikopleura dioica TaxID=34765 RepID=E4XJ79_OIKDI|nr:unnamed protein product [Oikopleura dioica]
MQHLTDVYFTPFDWITCWGSCIEESGITTNNGFKLLSSDKAKKRTSDEKNIKNDDLMFHELEFDALDQNGDGFISLKEWTGTNKNFANFDISEDNLIDEDEFFVSQNIIQALSVEFRRIVGSKNQMMSFNDALTFLEQKRNVTYEENLQTFDDADNDNTRTLSLFEFAHLNLH